MSLELYDHQKKALKKIENGSILCGGVGSGKSITSIAYYYLLNGGTITFLTGGKYGKMRKKPLDLYIITTARKRDTFEWEGELAPFLLSTHPECNIYSNIVVVDSWNNISKYAEVKNAYFIFDEQRVIGSGKWVKSFIKIAKSNRWVLLSATPGDTWQDYIPVFIANGFYKNRTEFIREHVIYSRFSKFPKVDHYVNTGKLLKLRNKILITMDFERKTVTHHEDIYTTYDKDEYKEVYKNRWDPYKNEPIINAGGLCYLLRRIVNSDDSRQMALLEILEDHPKAIIFYSFDYELEILKKLGYDTKMKMAEWNGHNHEPVPDGPCWIYLVQYTAGCEGWNCITTDTIIFYSQSYSYKVMVQAAGRTDRINTPYVDLYYYHLKSKSGIDLAISNSLRNKRDFNESKMFRPK